MQYPSKHESDTTVLEVLAYEDHTSVWLWPTTADGGTVQHISLTHEQTHQLVGELYAAIDKADRNGFHD